MTEEQRKEEQRKTENRVQRWNESVQKVQALCAEFQREHEESGCKCHSNGFLHPVDEKEFNR
jgi:hypothetical protein